MNANIIDICVKIVGEGLVEDLKATSVAKIGNMYTSEEVETYTANFLRNIGYIPDEVRVVNVIASFDLGWKQRATGRIYDGFMIG